MPNMLMCIVVMLCYMLVQLACRHSQLMNHYQWFLLVNCSFKQETLCLHLWLCLNNTLTWTNASIGSKLTRNIMIKFHFLIGSELKISSLKQQIFLVKISMYSFFRVLVLSSWLVLRSYAANNLFLCKMLESYIIGKTSLVKHNICIWYQTSMFV